MKTYVGMSLLAGAVVLSGCEVTPETAYAKANSVEECYNYAVAEQRSRRGAGSVNASSGGHIAASLIGMAIGTAIAHDINKTRLEQCAKRFGAGQAEIDRITAERRTNKTSRTSNRTASNVKTGSKAGCHSGGGVMQGGSGLCTGY